MLLYLNGAFTGLLILSNVLAVKLFGIGSWVALPAAVIVYVFTYPLLDTITEVYGKEAARKTVIAGLITQLAAVIFIFATIKLPPASFFGMQNEYEAIFTAGFRVTVASLVSFLVSQNLDVYVFDRFKKKHGEKKLWIRNNASTMLSQLADTTIFISIAFLGTMPLPALLLMIFTQYAVKFLIAILDTPFVYLLVSICRRHEGKEIRQQAA